MKNLFNKALRYGHLSYTVALSFGNGILASRKFRVSRPGVLHRPISETGTGLAGAMQLAQSGALLSYCPDTGLPTPVYLCSGSQACQ